MSPGIHLYLPQMRLTHEAIVERALAAEAAGFEGIAFMDHLAPPLAAEQDMWEAMSVAAWVLGQTTTLSAGHLVLCDALRHPAVLARQVTSLDHASGGRFELGIGWGSVPAELATFGAGSTERADRVSRLAESLDVLSRLWSGEVIDHEGEHFTLVGAQQRPVPTRRIRSRSAGSGSGPSAWSATTPTGGTSPSTSCIGSMSSARRRATLRCRSSCASGWWAARRSGPTCSPSIDDGSGTRRCTAARSSAPRRNWPSTSPACIGKASTASTPGSPTSLPWPPWSGSPGAPGARARLEALLVPTRPNVRASSGSPCAAT